MKHGYVWIGAALWMAAACADDIQPGLWKITLNAGVAASPDWRPDPFALTQCLSESDARDPARLFAGMGGAGVADCDFLNKNQSGGNLSFDIRCGGALGIAGHGDMRFSATAVEGTLTVLMGEAGAEKVEMRSQIHAAYLGACPQNAP